MLTLIFTISLCTVQWYFLWWCWCYFFNLYNLTKYEIASGYSLWLSRRVAINLSRFIVVPITELLLISFSCVYCIPYHEYMTLWSYICVLLHWLGKLCITHFFVANNINVDFVVIVQGEVITTIGFLKEAPHVNIYGFNVYYKNRLILVSLYWIFLLIFLVKMLYKLLLCLL